MPLATLYYIHCDPIPPCIPLTICFPPYDLCSPSLWLSPILLWDLIQFIYVFKPLVSTHVPYFKYCQLLVLNFPLIWSPIWIILAESPQDLVSWCPEIREHIGARGTTFIGWSRSSLLAPSLLCPCLFIRPWSHDQAQCVFPPPSLYRNSIFELILALNHVFHSCYYPMHNWYFSPCWYWIGYNMGTGLAMVFRSWVYTSFQCPLELNSFAADLISTMCQASQTLGIGLWYVSINGSLWCATAVKQSEPWSKPTPAQPTPVMGAVWCKVTHSVTHVTPYPLAFCSCFQELAPTKFAGKPCILGPVW